MALRGKIVDFVRLHALDDPHDARRIGQIPVVQKEMPVGHVRIAAQVIYPIGVEQRRAAFNAVHIVALGQQQVGQVRAVLSCYTGNQRDLPIHCVPLVKRLTAVRRARRSTGRT
jgi:hypothetical protein